jgi:hypothetical protein
MVAVIIACSVSAAVMAFLFFVVPQFDRGARPGR